MKNSYLIAGMNLTQLVRLLRKNSVSLSPKYLLRILFLLQSATWSSIFEIIENKRYRRKIENTPVPSSPVFIIGHWRTGSTLLHQIMQHDEQMITPTLFQVAEPGCFIVSYRYYKPIMKHLLRKKRPMDQVKLGMNEPQEDEYAIFRLSGHSPLERLIFPKSSRYFLTDCDSFVPEGTRKKEWEKDLLFFFRKLNFGKNKTIVSKNPFHSFRIKELVSLYPDARFIHIFRHPDDVVPSTLHLWNIVQSQNCLNHRGIPPAMDEVVDFLNHTWNTIKQDLSAIPAENKYELRFEDLENDPLSEVQKLYDYFRFPLSDQYKKKLEAFLRELKSYQKNQYHLTADEKMRIRTRMELHMEYFGYK